MHPPAELKAQLVPEFEVIRRQMVGWMHAEDPVGIAPFSGTCVACTTINEGLLLDGRELKCTSCGTPFPFNPAAAAQSEHRTSLASAIEDFSKQAADYTVPLAQATEQQRLEGAVPPLPELVLPGKKRRRGAAQPLSPQDVVEILLPACKPPEADLEAAQKEQQLS